MSLSWGVVIAVVYVVFHVISFLVKEAEKKKQREREMEEVERRRVTMARLEIPGPATATTAFEPETLQPVPAPQVPAPTGRSLDEVAARRKQQLEQMRAKATAPPGTRSNVPVQMRQSTVAPPVQISAPPRGSSSTARIPAGLVDMERERRRRLEIKAREQAKTRADAKAVADRQARTRQQQSQRGAMKQLPQTVVEAEPEPLVITGRGVEQRRRSHSPLAQHLRDRRTLRNLIVLKEILDPPVAMRES